MRCADCSAVRARICSRSPLIRPRIRTICRGECGATSAPRGQDLDVRGGKAICASGRPHRLGDDACHAGAPCRRVDPGFFSQIVDITERKQREACLERYVNDAVWLGRIRGALDEDRCSSTGSRSSTYARARPSSANCSLRMRDDDGTIIAPGEFLPVAERYGLISEIDRWVIRQAASSRRRGTRRVQPARAASIGDSDVSCGSSHAQSRHRRRSVAAGRRGHRDRDASNQPQRAAVRRAAARARMRAGARRLRNRLRQLSYSSSSPREHLKIDIEFVREYAATRPTSGWSAGSSASPESRADHRRPRASRTRQRSCTLRELGVDPDRATCSAAPSRCPQTVQPRRSRGAPRPWAAVIRSPSSDPSSRLSPPGTRPHASGSATRTSSCDRSPPRVHRDKAYRGRSGMRSYLRDVATVWDEMELTPNCLEDRDDGGRVRPRCWECGRPQRGGWTRSGFIRLREGLIASSTCS